MREDRCQLCEKQIKWQHPGCREGRAFVSSQSRTGSSRGGQISAILRARRCQAGLQCPRCTLPPKHGTRSPGLLQDGRLLPCNRTPRTRAARCPSPARSRCQAPVPQKGRTDAGRGREPAARVQPCTAITVLLIPRGFRMSEPGVPCRGQLSHGRAAIPAHVVDAPRRSLLRLAQGEKPLLLCQAAGKENGQTSWTASQPCLLPDTLPALE